MNTTVCAIGTAYLHERGRVTPVHAVCVVTESAQITQRARRGACEHRTRPAQNTHATQRHYGAPQ